MGSADNSYIYQKSALLCTKEFQCKCKCTYPIHPVIFVLHTPRNMCTPYTQEYVYPIHLGICVPHTPRNMCTPYTQEYVYSTHPGTCVLHTPWNMCTPYTQEWYIIFSNKSNHCISNSLLSFQAFSKPWLDKTKEFSFFNIKCLSVFLLISCLKL